MLHGRKVYEDIQAQIGRTQRDLDAVSRDLERTNSQLGHLAAAEARDLGRLAEVRLGEIEARRVVEGLDAADLQVLALLEAKEREQAKTTRELEASEQRQKELEAERVARLATLDDARARHGEAVVTALADLEQTELYQFQQTRVMTVTSQSERAAERAAQRAAEREAKGRPYEESKLFMYLWSRRYGTPDYSAGNLVRALDRWVAKLCDYDRARLDYAMLLEIPERLQEHAEHLAADAQAELDELGSMQTDAFLEVGIPKLTAEVESLERALDESEQELELEESRHQGLRTERAELDAGDDRYTKEAVSVLRVSLAREPVPTLRADAARTATPADDAIASDIAAHRDQARQLRDQAQHLSKRQNKVMDDLNDLEEVRRRYRKSNYDSRHSTFRDGFDMGGLLDALRKGGIVVGDVLQEMNRNHRFRVPRPPRGPSGGGFSFPDFGSGRRPGSGGRSSGGGIRWPRPSSPRPRSGGGFKTGGGF